MFFLFAANVIFARDKTAKNALARNLCSALYVVMTRFKPFENECTIDLH